MTLSKVLPGGKAGRRRLAAGVLLCAAMLSPLSAMASNRCDNDTDQTMFELASLQTELMNVALICQEQDRYNAFVTHYRPVLSVVHRSMTTYFARRGGQRAQDAYITNLANARGQEATALGSDFCPRNSRLFAEVMSLPNLTDLPAYAAAKDLVPQRLGSCASHGAPAHHAPARRPAR
jgi:hypothetical protein